MAGASRETGVQDVRRHRLIREQFHDLLRVKGKWAEPTVCPDCQAVFHRGRWQWEAPPAQASYERCPACQRIRDRAPAGFLTVEGQFFVQHRDEVLNLLRNEESKAKAEHALKRIIAVDVFDKQLHVSTTDPHLARALGEALYRAYRGQLDYHYAPQSNLMRVRWQR